jgi:formylglycine-generating enzyme required for sulfatase activity
VHACNGDYHLIGHSLPTGSMTTCEGGFTGIFDMSGNVGEWTSDLVSTKIQYLGGSFHDCTNPGGCPSNDLAYGMRCTGQFPSPTNQGQIGFRCCLSF